MTPKYKRMISLIANTGPKEWSVYMLRCGDGTLYTGIAKNVAKRFNLHSRGKGATYTKTHLPVKLIYQEVGLTRSQALIREAKIKQLPKMKKENLVQEIRR